MTAVEAMKMIEAEQKRHNEIMSLLTSITEVEPRQQEQTKGVPTMWGLKEAASQTGLSYDYIRKLCIQGKIPHIKAGSKYLINGDKLREYMNQGEQVSA